MRSKFVFLATILSIHICFAQVGIGINTDSPQEALDVNGDVALKGSLLLGGNTRTLGNSGQPGEFLVSKGNESAEWATLSIPKVTKGNYYLYSSNVQYDDVGVMIPAGNVSENVFAEGDPISSWIVIDDLTMDVDIPEITPSTPVTKALNNLSVTLQIVSQTQTAGAIFAVGVFVDGGLALASSILISGGGVANPMEILTMQGLVDNLTAGKHTVQVATKRVNSSSSIAVGTFLPTVTNLNSFMTRSTLQLNVYALNVN